VTVYYQLSDPVYRVGVIAVACWFVVGILYFALFARHRMILRRKRSSQWSIAKRADAKY
jgi:ethanolamine permease